MSMRTLGILASVTILLIIAAVVSSDRGSYTPSLTERPRLFPDLTKRINEVARIEITAPDQAISLEKRDGGWADADRGGYPVRFEPAKSLLISLSDAEVLEQKTADPANHARLGVLQPRTEGASSTLVTLRNSAGDSIASLILGKVRQLGDARFVRKDGENEVLLIDGRLDVSSTTASWLDREVIRLGRDKIERVTIAPASGRNFTIQRDPDNRQQFEFIELPPGREVNARSQLSSIAYALSYADLDDVQPESSIDFELLPPPLLATYETNDNMAIDVTVWTRDIDKWVSLNVTPLTPDTTPETASRIDELNDRFAGWIYNLSPSVTTAWDQTLSQLTRPIPEPGP